MILILLFFFCPLLTLMMHRDSSCCVIWKFQSSFGNYRQCFCLNSLDFCLLLTVLKFSLTKFFVSFFQYGTLTHKAIVLLLLSLVLHPVIFIKINVFLVLLQTVQISIFCKFISFGISWDSIVVLGACNIRFRKVFFSVRFGLSVYKLRWFSMAFQIFVNQSSLSVYGSVWSVTVLDNLNLHHRQNRLSLGNISQIWQTAPKHCSLIIKISFSNQISFFHGCWS